MCENLAPIARTSCTCYMRYNKCYICFIFYGQFFILASAGRVLIWRLPPACPVYLICVKDIISVIYAIYFIYAIYTIFTVHTMYTVDAIYRKSLDISFELYGAYAQMR